LRGSRRLFTSAQAMALLDTTPSVKTRLYMATELLGPRCSDPTSATVVVNSFRFAVEKAAVRCTFLYRFVFGAQSAVAGQPTAISVNSALVSSFVFLFLYLSLSLFLSFSNVCM
jgi:hypothetical protein